MPNVQAQSTGNESIDEHRVSIKRRLTISKILVTGYVA